MYQILYGIASAVLALLMSATCLCQSSPATAGETLGGKRIVLADATRGHSAALVAGFSHEGGMGMGAWLKALKVDRAPAGTAVYQMAMLEKAPGFMRGMIKKGMRKRLSGADEDNLLVLTQDEHLWRSYFDVSDDKDPYVILIDADGKVLWRGRGPAAELESQLRAAKH